MKKLTYGDLVPGDVVIYDYGEGSFAIYTIISTMKTTRRYDPDTVISVGELDRRCVFNTFTTIISHSSGETEIDSFDWDRNDVFHDNTKTILVDRKDVGSTDT